MSDVLEGPVMLVRHRTCVYSSVAGWGGKPDDSCGPAWCIDPHEVVDYNALVAAERVDEQRRYDERD